MRKFTIWKLATTLAFLVSMNACSNSSSPDDSDDYTDSTSSKNSDDGKNSNSSSNTCDVLKKLELGAPTNFTVTKESDSLWLLSWDYTRNESRAETNFEIESLNMDDKSPKWESEGTTNADVTIYMLKGAKKAGKYYRVVAIDKCGRSKESNRQQIKADGNATEDSTTTTVTSDMPTDLALTRIAPSIWELSWKYSNLSDDPNRSFVIQTSKLKDFKWKSIKSKIEGNVRNYYIQGRDQIETYYRIAVVNSGDTSAFTEAVQLTPDVAYRDYMALNTPTPSTKFTLAYITGIEADKDTSSEDKVYTEAVATYTITDNFISKYIVESEYTDTVYYEARWFTSLENFNYYKGNCEGKKKTDKCDSCYWTETFPYQEPSISKRFSVYDDYADAEKKTKVFNDCASKYKYTAENHAKLYDPDTDPAEWKAIAANEANMALCLEHYLRGICGYYVQIRAVWKDNANGKGKGETDWSEWTQPFNLSDISGADDLCNTK
jgi:hypothetical protein